MEPERALPETAHKSDLAIGDGESPPTCKFCRQNALWFIVRGSVKVSRGEIRGFPKAALTEPYSGSAGSFNLPRLRRRGYLGYGRRRNPAPDISGNYLTPFPLNLLPVTAEDNFEGFHSDKKLAGYRSIILAEIRNSGPRLETAKKFNITLTRIETRQ